MVTDTFMETERYAPSVDPKEERPTLPGVAPAAPADPRARHEAMARAAEKANARHRGEHPATLPPAASTISTEAAELIEALRRISALTPRAANAATARDMHTSVKAIADSAIDRFEGRL